MTTKKIHLASLTGWRLEGGGGWRLSHCGRFVKVSQTVNDYRIDRSAITCRICAKAALKLLQD